MSLPADIERFLARSFPPDELEHAVQLLGHARIHDGTAPNARLLRCAAFASRGKLKNLERLASQLAVDWRDVIMAGEYELQGKETVRVRDLSMPLQV
ncbi:hypothetical protein [Arenimonas composti]|uniref:Uncharacterized protein n=1 Tax=Arenimonas composti TR7-09 = DSM 18010 TaxID=1121013 RepID=A0A091BWM9_9GAMM|nr:hypothetical protein [Arenimonas composti]KFN48750.1 hypothetical protein P873_13920 [Arenimonas composti TR7-09 = DSM 18010]